jgi:hypothetical protein
MREKNDELVESYLDRLERELHDLPGARRREVVDEVRGHIVEARAELASDNEAEVRNILERLGDPSEIAAEARMRFGIQPRSGSNWREVSAIVLLLLGGFVAFFGWIVGVILLWISERWTLRDKLIGTLVVPGGLATTFVGLMFGQSVGTSEGCVQRLDPRTGAVLGEVCNNGASTGETITSVLYGIALLVVLLSPFFTTVYLALRLRNAPQGGSQRGYDGDVIVRAS